MPGLITDVAYEETNINLGCNEKLFLATDGVMLTEKRIAATKFERNTNNAEKFMGQVKDDATLVIIERPQASSRAIVVM
jgi:hypothetical protein